MKEIKNDFENVVKNAPRYDPFSIESRLRWSEYEESCKSYEAILREHGDDL